jgi:hypothetical protein
MQEMVSASSITTLGHGRKGTREQGVEALSAHNRRTALTFEAPIPRLPILIVSPQPYTPLAVDAFGRIGGTMMEALLPPRKAESGAPVHRNRAASR